MVKGRACPCGTMDKTTGQGHSGINRTGVGSISGDPFDLRPDTMGLQPPGGAVNRKRTHCQERHNPRVFFVAPGGATRGRVPLALRGCAMAEGTEHHLEHAEHAQHAALNPFDRKVATSMAIIAAALAGVALLSHRGHNDVLRLQTEANINHTEANIRHTEANIRHTKASDMWGFYQAKNIRSHEFQAYLRMAEFLPSEPGTGEARQQAIKYWTGQVEKYEGKKSPEGKRGDSGDLAQIKKDAEVFQEQAREKEQEASAKEQQASAREHESHFVHHSVNWIDFGHLGLEFALVLCSVAVLTKLRGFWFSGIAVAIAGAGLALYGLYAMFLMHHGN
jgi:Domain of unknown function (DUF4337)